MLDEVRPFAEYPGAHSFAVNDEAFGFLSNCFNEMADAFDSKYFHAGLDESWDLGFGKSEEVVKRIGAAPRTRRTIAASTTCSRAVARR